MNFFFVLFFKIFSEIQVYLEALQVFICRRPPTPPLTPKPLPKSPSTNKTLVSVLFIIINVCLNVSPQVKCFKKIIWGQKIEGFSDGSRKITPAPVIIYGWSIYDQKQTRQKTLKWRWGSGPDLVSQVTVFILSANLFTSNGHAKK